MRLRKFGKGPPMALLLPFAQREFGTSRWQL